jgi:hypothetical protein
MSAQTPTALVMAFGADADERLRGKWWGAHGALEKREEGEKRGRR